MRANYVRKLLNFMLFSTNAIYDESYAKTVHAVTFRNPRHKPEAIVRSRKYYKIKDLYFTVEVLICSKTLFESRSSLDLLFDPMGKVNFSHVQRSFTLASDR